MQRFTKLGNYPQHYRSQWTHPPDQEKNQGGKGTGPQHTEIVALQEITKHNDLLHGGKRRFLSQRAHHK